MRVYEYTSINGTTSWFEAETEEEAQQAAEKAARLTNVIWISVRVVPEDEAKRTMDLINGIVHEVDNE